MTDNLENNYDICTRYDTNTLNDLDENTRSLFEEISEKCIDRKLGIGNTTLMKLILNNRENKKPIFNNISGPVSLTVHWSEEYKKMVYIFGEAHGYENACPGKECPKGEKIGTNIFNPIPTCIPTIQNNKNIQEDTNSINIVDYLKELFKNTNVFIDFFIELDLPNKTISKGKYSEYFVEQFVGGHLRDLWNHFIPCINVESRAKPIKYCELTRVHYTDMRLSDTENDAMNYLYNLILIYLRNKDKVRFQEKFYIELRSTIKIRKFINELSRNPKQAVMEQLKNNKHINKEIKRSYLNDNLIYAWFEYHLERISNKKIWDDRMTFSDVVKNDSKIIVDLLNLKENLDAKQKNNLFQYITKIYKYISELQVFKMDIYMLCRIFKKFKVKPNSNQPDEAYNIIIYAGDYHSNSYRSFLEILDFKNVYSAGAYKHFGSNSKHYNRCLKMNDFPQPFFTGTPTSFFDSFFLRNYTDFWNNMNWSLLSGNPSPDAIDLLEANMDKINWMMLSKNPNAIHLLKANQDKIDWINLSGNPNAIELLKANKDKIAWNMLSGNPGAIDFLLEDQDKIDWGQLSSNPSPGAIDLLEANMDKINWMMLSKNPNAIHLLEANQGDIDWVNLSGNPNAIHLLEANQDKINWDMLSGNPNAIHLLEANQDKINWHWISKNPSIFDNIPFIKPSIFDHIPPTKSNTKKYKIK